MADNVAITAGTGTTIATDDVAGVHHQQVKLIDGTLGSTTAIKAGGGVEAGALLVTVASDSTGVLSVDDNGASLTVDNADITTIAGAVAGTEMQVDVVAALPAGTNAIGKLAANSGVDIGDVDVTSISAGTNTIGNVGLVPRTTGGLTIFRSLDLDESEEEVKATAGQVYGMWVTNTATSTRFVKFYNLTAANTTVGTSTPVITIGIPGNTSDDVSGLFSSGIGIAFDTAISVAATTAAADADTGAPSAGDVIINLFYA